MAIAADTVERPDDIEQARLRHGQSHISCFAFHGRTRHFLVEDGAVGYQVKARVAVALGDPLTSSERRPEAIDAFMRLCAAQGWAACFFQADAAERHLYRAAGLRTVKFGEEAVVDVAAFQLRSPARANARHEIARARRAGLEPVVLHGLRPSDPEWPEIEEVSARWLEHHGGREMGFSLGRLREVVDRTTWYTLARDGNGRVHAFCSWVRLGRDGLALDLVRRRPDAGPGAVDLCVVAGIEQARLRGLARVSLGLVPLRDSLDDAQDRWATRRLRRHLFRRGFAGYHYQSLARFKGKFATHWESRDVALPRGSMFLVALVALVRLHTAGSPPLADEKADPQPASLA